MKKLAFIASCAVLASSFCFAQAEAVKKADNSPAKIQKQGRHTRSVKRNRPKRSPEEIAQMRKRMMEVRKERGIPGVIISSFGKTADGKSAKLYRLMGHGGMIMDLTDCGARQVRIYAPDRNGNLADITAGFTDALQYQTVERSFGATIGRYANRIGNGKFKIDGVEYNLPLNNGPDGMRCSLHGGTNSFSEAVWDGEPVRRGRSIGVCFTHVDKDGAQGYPGTLTVKVTHWLTEKNVWRIEYSATVDGKATPINLTNHAYFNLKGICNGTIEDHELQIFADATTPTDKAQIPTGEIKSVEGTPFDFRTPRVIGERIDADDEQIKIGKGYDHNWVLNNKDGKLAKAAVLSEKTTGRMMEVWTTEPAIQIYCGNMIGGGKAQPTPITEKCGKVVPYRGAMCLETQHYPDSPNKPQFPNTILKPGEVYSSVTEYRFGVTK